MRMFHFGQIVTTPTGLVAQYAIHIQCPWRIQTHEIIVTGSQDWYEPSLEADFSEEESDSWEPGKGGSLQEDRLRRLFECPLQESRTIINKTDRFFVVGAAADSLVDCQVHLSHGLILGLYPCGSAGEAWRLIQPTRGEPHFVVEIGGIQAPVAKV